VKPALPTPGNAVVPRLDCDQQRLKVLGKTLYGNEL